MPSYTRQLLSASTNGRGIKVGATATPGTLLHTAVTGTSAFDEVYLWVSNSSASPVGLTIEFGGTSTPDDHVVDTCSIPANSPPIPIVTGQNLQNGLAVLAFASVANVLVMTGYVNRIQ